MKLGDIHRRCADCGHVSPFNKYRGHAVDPETCGECGSWNLELFDAAVAAERTNMQYRKQSLSWTDRFLFSTFFRRILLAVVGTICMLLIVIWLVG